MRTTVINTLIELAERDNRIMLITGDLGFMVIDPFTAKFPDRFINVGVAEQNMIGIATGLAEAGFIPFVYSIAPFATLRPYEFIRNGPIAHHLPVRILGIGTGMDYSTNGLTHYGLEDLSVMRIQPGITTIAPADSAQARTALLSTWDLEGPIYYGLGKDDRIIIPQLDGRFELGKMQIIKEGVKVLVICMGAISNEVVKAVDEAEKNGVRAAIGVVSSLNPVDALQISKTLHNYSTVITVESQYINGGLGSMMAEIIAENRISCQLKRFGVRKTPDGKTGSPEYMRSINGLTKEAIYQLLLSLAQDEVAS